MIVLNFSLKGNVETFHRPRWLLRLPSPLECISIKWASFSSLEVYATGLHWLSECCCIRTPSCNSKLEASADTEWLQIFVRQYYHNTLCITKIFNSKIYSSPYVFYHRILFFTGVEELPAIAKWKTFLYRSIQFYSCSKPGSVKIATSQRDWASHPVYVIGKLTQN